MLTWWFSNRLALIMNPFTGVWNGILFLTELLLFNLLSVLAKVQETDHSPEPGLDLTLVVPSHKLFEFVDFLFNHKRLAIN